MIDRRAEAAAKAALAAELGLAAPIEATPRPPPSVWQRLHVTKAQRRAVATAEERYLGRLHEVTSSF
jgi:hypothetical protein